MTIIRLNDSEAATSLLAHLHAQQDVWVDRIDDERLRASLFGSYSAEAMHLELHLRVRAWEAAERARGRAVALEFEDV